MSEKVKEDVSRRKALSLLGGALGLALALDAFESEEAEAQATTETPAAGAPAAAPAEGGGTAVSRGDQIAKGDDTRGVSLPRRRRPRPLQTRSSIPFAVHRPYARFDERRFPRWVDC